MRFLIINRFAATAAREYKKTFKRVATLIENNGLLNDVDNTYYQITSIADLKQYVFDPEYGLDDSEAGSRFDMIDIVFIFGDSMKKPWSRDVFYLLLLVRTCMLTKKPLFISGSSFLDFVYLSSTDTQVFKVLTNPLVMDIDESIKVTDAAKNTQSEVLLDLKTGDVFFCKESSWKPFLNIGFHHKEKGSSPSFHLRGLFKIKRKAGNGMTDPQSDDCVISNDYLQHYLFQGVEKRFDIGKPSQWRVHPIEYINPAWKFDILASSDSNPAIVSNNNTVASYFNLGLRSDNGFKILDNFVTKAIMDMKNGSGTAVSVFNIVRNKKGMLERDKQRVDLLVKQRLNYDTIDKTMHCGMTIRKKVQFHPASEHNAIQNSDSMKVIKCNRFVKRINSSKKIKSSNNDRTSHRENDKYVIKNVDNPLFGSKQASDNNKQLNRSVDKPDNAVERVGAFNFGNIFQKTGFKYDIKRVEKVRSIPQIRCASAFIDTTRQQYLERKKKEKLFVTNKDVNHQTSKQLDFITCKRIEENCIGFLNNSKSYLPVADHKFRDFRKNNWVSAKDFRAY